MFCLQLWTKKTGETGEKAENKHVVNYIIQNSWEIMIN